VNTQLTRALARIKIAPLHAAAAVLLSAALALLAIGVARGAPTPRTPAPSAPPVVAPMPAPADTAAGTPASAAAAPLTAEDVDTWLDGYLPYALKTGDIAGAEISIVKDGAIVTQRGYGFSNVEKRTPVDPQLTLFRPGSVSKLVVWTAVMQLVEQGKIDLDADINQYLDYKVTGLGGKPITMRNLMQHTAGFEEHARGIISTQPLPTFEQILKQGVPTPIFAPGSTPAYSNYGASLAGYIVERVSGEPFDDYLEKHIFAPLDMKHSSFRQPLPAELQPLMSTGYRLGSGEAEQFEYVGPRPAGSMSSTAEDMAHFMIAHLQGGEYHGNRILSAAAAEQLHNSPYADGIGPLNRMELGFFETNINGREVIGHLGDTDWFHTSLHLFMKENAGLYASFNSPGKEGAVQTLRTQLFQDFADRYFPAAVPHPVKAQVDEKTQAAHSALMSGVWEVSRRADTNFLKVLEFIGETKVAANKKGELMLPFPGPNGKPRHWVEIAPFVWQDVNGHDRAAARVVDGKPVRFSFDFLSPFMVYDRVPWYESSAWLMPLLLASLVALALTAIVWPVAALVRRRYRAPLALDPKSLRAWRWSRIAALAIVAALCVWGLFVSLIAKDTGTLGGKLDPLLVFAQLFSIVAFVGGSVAMLWNLVVVWRGQRRWPAKLWSVVLTLAAFTVLWVGLVARLMVVGTDY